MFDHKMILIYVLRDLVQRSLLDEMILNNIIFLLEYLKKKEKALYHAIVRAMNFKYQNNAYETD